ncbi:MAG: HNH endonuclease [Planctomycetota bacterium]
MPWAIRTDRQIARAHAPRVRDGRPSACKRGYDRRWRKARDHYLRRHPLCVQCERQGRTVCSAIVDHVVPHQGDPLAFWDQRDWQALCKRCHDRKTVSEDGGLGNEPNVRDQRGACQ